MRHSRKRRATRAERAIAIIAARVKKVLGARVRTLRNQRNWSQRDLAAACGLAPSQVGSIERGQSNATTTTLLKIADKFDTTLTRLFSGLR